MLKRFFILTLSVSFIVSNWGLLSEQDDEATEQVDSSDSEDEEDADKEDDLDVDSLEEENSSEEEHHEESLDTETHIETEHTQESQTQERTESWQSSNVQVEDSDLNRTVEGQLKTTFKNYNFNYTIKDGIVTLTGVVNSNQDKEAIEQEFKRIPGVKKVINSLQVK